MLTQLLLDMPSADRPLALLLYALIVWSLVILGSSIFYRLFFR